MQLITIVGCFLSILAMLGFANAILFGCLWFLYLSLYYGGQTFSGFQWDILLLETGFLTIFYAPFVTLRRYAINVPPAAVIRWLQQWLLFRLMFSSGVVKLLSQGDTWWSSNALVRNDSACTMSIFSPLSKITISSCHILHCNL